MQKRRAHQYQSSSVDGAPGNGGVGSLDVPLGDPDVMAPRRNGRFAPPAPLQATKKQQKYRRKTQTKSWAVLILVMAMVVLLSLLFLGSSGGSSTGATAHHDHFLSSAKHRLLHRITKVATQQAKEEQELPLSQFESLQYAFEHSQLVGLYFAASWCPMSTPVTEQINKYMGPHLLGSDDSDTAPMSLVYISSDRSAEDAQNYMGPNWMAVPYESDERTALQKHFSTCSKLEVPQLKIDRKYEIPTLFILSLIHI